MMILSINLQIMYYNDISIFFPNYIPKSKIGKIDKLTFFVI